MPRKISPLSDSAIKAAKPKESIYKLTDGQGLYLDIKPNGSKLWRFKYRFGGKDMIPLSLGPYPDLSLLKARQLCSTENQDRMDFKGAPQLQLECFQGSQCT